jgi:DNA-binding NarL/FixJ family response regulator
VADDSQGIRERVIKLLEGHFDVVGFAENGHQAIAAALALVPDLVVLDISMPGLNGIEVASRLRDLGCTGKIVFLTVHEDPDYLKAAFLAGARGYVYKSRVATELIPALQAALAGKELSSPFSAANASQHREKSTSLFGYPTVMRNAKAFTSGSQNHKVPRNPVDSENS